MARSPDRLTGTGHGPTRTRRGPVAGTSVAVSVAAALLLVSGCGSSGSTPAPSTTAARPAPSSPTSPTATTRGPRSTAPRGGLPVPGGVDGDQPEAVAAWVLTAWYSYDTALDTSPSDTARRALPWLTPTLAAIVRQAAPVAAPGATWTRWTKAHAYATVHLTASSEDHPPDTALVAYRAYLVDLTLHPAQPPSSSDHLVAFAHLRRADLHSPWLVEEVLTR